MRLSALFTKRQQPSVQSWQPVLENVSWLLLEKAARGVIGLSVGIWTARYLGPQEYGSLNYSLSFVMLFGCVGTLGIDYLGVRELVRQPEERASILGTLVGLRLATGFTLAIAASFCTLIDGTTTSRGMTSVLSLILLLSAGDVLDLWFQAEMQARRAAIARSAAFLAAAASRVVLIAVGAPVIAFAWLLVAETTLTSAALVLSFRTAGGRMGGWRFSRSRAKSLLSESWPNIVSCAAMAAYMRVDRIMLGTMKGESTVGVYSAASTLVEIWYVLPVAIVASATPLITRSHQISKLLYIRQIAHLARLLSVIAWVLVAVLIFCALLVIPRLYGDAYAGTNYVLCILVWSLPFGCLGVAASPWYLNERRFLTAMWRHLAGAVVNLVLNFLLIPAHGAAGAAVATVIASSIAHVFANAFTAHTRPLFLIQTRALLVLPPKEDKP